MMGWWPSLRSGVAVNPRTYFAFTCLITCSNVNADKWWHSSTITCPDLVRREKRQRLSQTSTRQCNVLCEFLAACDHTWLVVCREPHRLSLVEFGVLKCRQPA